jgi:hypothetical protein
LKEDINEGQQSQPVISKTPTQISVHGCNHRPGQAAARAGQARCSPEDTHTRYRDFAQPEVRCSRRCWLENQSRGKNTETGNKDNKMGV